VETPSVTPHLKHVYHIYAIQAESRDRLSEELAAKGIQTNIHYPIPVHLQKAYSDLGYKAGDFPVSETLARRTLSLPLYPELAKPQVEQVAEAVRGITTK
jgi:dTDP-4-amino-4,6-dideoxygalactose transaminase